MTQEFRLKNIEEIKCCFIIEIDQNKLMSKKHKNVYTILNYTGKFLISTYAITECVSISAFNSLLSIPIAITSLGIMNCNNSRIEKSIC